MDKVLKFLHKSLSVSEVAIVLRDMHTAGYEYKGCIESVRGDYYLFARPEPTPDF